MNFKKKMTNVYKQQVEDLEMLVPNFKIASAIDILFDEVNCKYRLTDKQVNNNK